MISSARGCSGSGSTGVAQEMEGQSSYEALSVTEGGLGFAVEDLDWGPGSLEYQT